MERRIPLLLILSIITFFGYGQALERPSKEFKQKTAEELKEYKHARIHNFKITSTQKITSAMAMVLVEGEINLYKHIYTGTRATFTGTGPGGFSRAHVVDETYVIHKKETDEYYGMFNNKQIKKYFLPMISDNEELTEEILSIPKYDWLYYLKSIIEKYNTSYENE